MARRTAPRNWVRLLPLRMQTVPTASRPAEIKIADGSDRPRASIGRTLARIIEPWVCQFSVRGQLTNHATDANRASDASSVGRHAAHSEGPNTRKLARMARIAGMRNSQ